MKWMLGFIMVVAMMSLVSAGTQQDLYDSAVSIWRADTDGSYPDNKSLYDGTVEGASYNAAGHIDGAYDYDGVDDYVDLGSDVSSLSPKNLSWSITGWFRTSTANDGRIFGTADFGTPDDWLDMRVIDNDGRLRVTMDDAVDPDLMQTIGVVDDGAWHFFSITRNVSANSWNLSLDSVHQDSSDEANSSIDTNEFLIGALWGSGGADNLPKRSFFNGSLDELIIFNRTITQTEIDYLYNSGAGVSLSPETESSPESTPYNGSKTTEFGYNNLKKPTLRRTVVDLLESTVNNSVLWDGHTWDEVSIWLYNQTLAGDNRFVNIDGDNMTGDLVVTRDVIVQGDLLNTMPHLYGISNVQTNISEVDTWTPVVFNSSLGDADGFTFINDTAVNVTKTGHYFITFGCHLTDSSPSPASTMAMRINMNGMELEGSYVEANAIRQDADQWISHTTYLEAQAGEYLQMEIIADDVDVHTDVAGNWATTPVACTGTINWVHPD